MKKPIETLQENASGFFEKVATKYASSMKCSEGCSKCCYTDITVFEVESIVITSWFKNLDSKMQSELRELWKSPVIDGACSFLYNDRCSVYEARPIICRTQGAPLFVQVDNTLDYCPLNFTEGDPPKEDWLNLDRLNTLLSFAAKTAGEEKRVRLKKLKQELIQL